MEKIDQLGTAVKEAEKKLAAGKQELEKARQAVEESAATIRADIARLEAELAAGREGAAGRLQSRLPARRPQQRGRQPGRRRRRRLRRLRPADHAQHAERAEALEAGVLQIVRPLAVSAGVNVDVRLRGRLDSACRHSLSPPFTFRRGPTENIRWHRSSRAGDRFFCARIERQIACTPCLIAFR